MYKIKRNYPLAYIISNKEFYGLNFQINENVLVPRPETEQIVDLALEEIKKFSESNILLVDIGTGSGCIPVSILKNLQSKKIGQIKARATDISKKALSIANKNAQNHNIDIDFKQGNLAEPILAELQNYKNIIITANLPYLTKEEFHAEDSIKKEPRRALIAENEGLKYYKKFLQQLSEINLGEKNIFIFFEINPDQSRKTQKLVKKYLSAEISVIKDINNLDRIVKISI